METETNFDKLAHTVPAQLGGMNTCENVCNSCNEFFGNASDKLPAIETVLKETFNITRTFFLKADNDFGKNKTLTRFSSIYFNIDFSKNQFRLKPAYKTHRTFQGNLCKQLKRGLLKIFLEERERQFKDGLDAKFNFIREFARRGIGDYPIFYFERKYGIILTSQKWVKNPQLFFESEYQFKYLVSEPGFFEFELLSHVFGIPVSRNWELGIDNYLKLSLAKKKGLFRSCKLIRKFSDVDFALTILCR